jgi:hypothetical protein
MARRPGWLGFDGRVFLTKDEHDTYMRRLPVRYAAKNLERGDGICVLCKKPATADNVLQAAHLIPFNIGITRFWLTPDWLDQPHNLAWAHRQVCNKKVEIEGAKIIEHLRDKFGIEVARDIIEGL